MPTSLLKNLPSVTELLESPQLRAVRDRVSQSVIAGKVRTYLDDLRLQIQTTAAEVVLPTVSDLAHRLAQRILQTEHSQLRPVINATGVLLPEGMGGAPLAASAIEAMAAVATDYASLELDLETGRHCERSQCVAALLHDLTGAEAALVVTSGRAATMLALSSLAARREVVVARSQLLEAADGFRLSEAISASGAVLREVGAANSARVEDYRHALNSNTAAVLLVGTNHAAQSASGSQISPAELATLTQSHGAVLLHDVGDGAIFDLSPFSMSSAPLLTESIRAGVDLVLTGGERIGGPQCGLLLGRAALIEGISRHPLARAVQADRTTLAALAATLRLYDTPDLAREAVPLLQLSTTSVENLQNRARRLAPQLAACSVIGAAEAVVCSTAGQPDSWCIDLTPAEGWSVSRLAHALRTASPAIVGRVEGERLRIDLRTVFVRQDQQIADVVAAIVQEKPE